MSALRAAAQRSGQLYQPEIDGLRAIAILVVIIHHYFPALLPNGFVGVDIFFVISGYVITLHLSRVPDTNWSEYLLGFRWLVLCLPTFKQRHTLVSDT